MEVALVIIVLLPKTDGGLRPIGLLPLLPRVWMRARRDQAQRWERYHGRDYLYAGEGKGADIAAWKQAARAEYATTVGASYGQVLLDLVKAFERVPHDVLVREAIRQGYPLTLLRLSLAAYRLDRTVRVGDATSVAMMASRGITAGSGLATTELRVLMLDIIDTAMCGVIGVTVTLYVDDVAAEAAGTQRTVVDSLVPCVLAICDRMTDDRLEVSAKKSVCTAGTKRLGSALSDGLSR